MAPSDLENAPELSAASPDGVGASLGPRAVRAAYRAANADSLRRRIDLGVLAFATIGVAVLLEESDAYARRPVPVGVLLAAQAAVCLLAPVCARWERLRDHLPGLGAILVSMLIGAVLAEDVLLGLGPQTIAVGLISILACTAALFPWGWRAQLGVSLSTVVGFGAAELVVFAEPVLVHAHIGLGTVAVATVAGALLLDRYRYSAFLRAVRLEGASRASREEAEISAALVEIGHTLNRAVGQPDVFDRVNRRVVDLLGCDWSATVVQDRDRGVYRVVGLHGLPEPVRERAQGMELEAARLPFFRELAKGGMVEIGDAAETDLFSARFVEWFGLSAALGAPIVLGSEVVGAVTNGYRTHRGPFSRKHRSITAGIAQATAIAVQNQRLFEDLARANRVKSQFVSTMSHELRTPVNVILGYSRVLEEGDAGDLTPEQRDLVGRIRRSGQRLGELVDGILDLSRLESEAERLKVDWLDVDAMVASLDEEFRPQAEEAGLELSWENHLGGRRVSSEPARLRTILRHLLSNAIKFTPRGFVRVELSQSGAALVVAVSDSGIGIAPENVDAIFEEFRQVDSTDSREFGGVGLGLHMVRRLVDRLGGSVAVVSEVGQGSVFTIEVPVQFARSRGA